MQRLVAALSFLVLAGACDGKKAGRSDHEGNGDDDCTRDACGVCDGDGSSCTPPASIVMVLDVEGATLAVFPFTRDLGSASELVSTPSAIVPGKVVYRDVSLSRRATESLELASWRRAMEDGAATMQNATLTLLDSELGPIARWELVDAWPSSLEVTREASGLRETVVVTNSGVRRIVP